MSADGIEIPDGEEEEAMRERVLAVLDEIRPFLQSDGGDIALVSVREGIVRVRMQGACAGCATSAVTLKLGVERRLKQEIPGLKGLEAV